MQTLLQYGGTYCIDMGILVKLDAEFPKKQKAFTAIWNEIEVMVENGELFSCEFLERSKPVTWRTHIRKRMDKTA